MLPRRRCPFCRRWYRPNPRLNRRQQTCGRAECRRQQKQKSNREWRAKNPDYFRDVYPHQKEKYGTRADYMRHYRQQHPDYVRRNAAFVRKWRQQLGQTAVSYTSPDLQPNRLHNRNPRMASHIALQPSREKNFKYFPRSLLRMLVQCSSQVGQSSL
jgi:hypothetical protein